MTMLRIPCLLALIAALSVPLAAADDFPQIVNTQKAGENPPSPAEAAAAFTLPDGFRLTLFAGEPDVAQPIAMEFDDRGRLWVAECYTYTGRTFGDRQGDRIVILEDADNDGRHDKRTVFWDQGFALTSLCYGADGMYILNNGTLSHLADRNRDDRPDGEPVVLLDGFDTGPVGHNIVNGLMWGPDGWLYGRHGIQATSYVGRPGDVASKRTPINCSIWRYHPRRQVFEAVTHGTTNPWGLDYNEQGQFFFTNNVNGHLWHVIPGAHYQRMYGEDFNPHLYALIDQTADHYHWDHSRGWTNSRDGAHGADELGGGHSHCGGMIYLGDNWPAEYRGGMFMGNTHGRRVNHDRLVRKGSSYVGEHAEDLIFANQPWFRGVSLIYGPDGGVYLSDWSDLGECHDNDGVHRTSGRIYKITYGDVSGKPRADGGDMGKLAPRQLAALHGHANQWYVRHARRALVEAAAAGAAMGDAVASLQDMAAPENMSIELRLNALWTLHCLEALPAASVDAMLADDNEHIRVWGIRFAAESQPIGRARVDRFHQMAENDPSAFVRLTLASALQRMPLETRWPIANHLTSHEQDAQDHHLRLMTWYGIEPAVSAYPEEAIQFIENCKWPLLQQFTVRRLTYEVEEHPRPVAELYKLLHKNADAGFRREILTGMVHALSGRKQVKAPAGWEAIRDKLLAAGDDTITRLTQELAVVHGDGLALEQVRAIAADGSKPPEQRRAALEVLITARPAGLPDLLLNQLGDRATSQLAIRGLAQYEDPRVPRAILNRYRNWPMENQREAISTLSARAAYARQLLDEVAQGSIPASDISAYHARQMQSLGDEEITARLGELWGTLRTTAAERREEIEQYRAKFSPAVLAKANLAHGRQLFAKSCANCHALYGEGANIGPDLTGSGRHNLDYLLENILDPSASVATQFRMSALRLASGQVVTGVIVQQTDQMVSVQTEKERLDIERGEVEEVKPSPVSLMPDGLLKNLADDDVRDLFGYLQGQRQVELPEEQGASAAGR